MSRGDKGGVLQIGGGGGKLAGSSGASQYQRYPVRKRVGSNKTSGFLSAEKGNFCLWELFSRVKRELPEWSG